MDFVGSFSEKLVALDLDIRDKTQAFQFVSANLTKMGIIKQGDQLYEKLIMREELMTTGIGRGFAIPHAFIPDVEKTVIYFIRTKNHVDFSSLDNKPVRYIFILVGPPHKEGLHLKILARVSRLINNPEFVTALERIRNASDFVSLVRFYDEQIAV